MLSAFGSYSWFDLHILFHEEWHKISVNGYIVPFTTKEYQILMSFFHHQIPMNIDNGKRSFLYADRKSLQQAASIPNKQLLRKHVSNTNAKLALFELQMKPFEEGYLLMKVVQHMHISH